MKESAKWHEKQLNKQLSKLGGRYGKMVQYMVVPNLLKKFRKLGLVFNKAYQQTKIEDENNKTIAEVDITHLGQFEPCPPSCLLLIQCFYFFRVKLGSGNNGFNRKAEFDQVLRDAK
jgi:hypothetical protein